MARARLRFRLHLVASAVLLLVGELGGTLDSLWPRSGAPSEGRPAGVARVRLASALSELYPQSGQFPRQGSAQAPQAARLSSSEPIATTRDGSNPSTVDDDDDEFNPIEWMLAQIDKYLPTLNLNYSLNPHKRFVNHQLDIDVERYYLQQWPPNMTLDQLQLWSVKAALRVAPMPLHTSWGYESRDDLRKGSLPMQDDARCGSHLSQLSKRLDKLQGLGVAPAALARPEGADSAPAPSARRGPTHEATPVENYEASLLYQTQDLAFARYLDTFGRVPEDVLLGNTKWFGSYAACTNTKLAANPLLGGTRRIKFRYCMAALKSNSWSSANQQQASISSSSSSSRQSAESGGAGSQQVSPIGLGREREGAMEDFGGLGTHSVDAKLDNYFIRVGVCLPESCDSSAFESRDNMRTVERLIKFQLAKPFNSDHYYISDLYCLPDRRSPLRTIPLLGKLLLLGILGWLALIGIATIVHLNVERFYKKAVREIRAKQEAARHAAGARGGTPAQSEAASQKADESDAIESSASNEQLHESDILRIKHYWLRLNIYLWDHSDRLIKGVNLIQCLSLYANWLKYTARVKLAVARLHAADERRTRIRERNRQLVDGIRRTERNNTVSAGNIGNANHQTAGTAGKATGVGKPTATLAKRLSSAAETLQDQQRAVEERAFANELERRLEIQDKADEAADEGEYRRRVDTSSLNALKVIALFWIIAGHCIFYLGSAVSNSAIVMLYVRDIAGFALINGAMYITELFFVITGCLTSYLAFKYNTFRLEQQASGHADAMHATDTMSGGQAKTPDDNRGNSYMESRIFRIPFWIMIAINRYMRIAPTYIVVYAVVKLVTVYIGGHGPSWDYGVAPNSMRRQCVKESWLPVVTLTTNFVDVYSHCIVGGWYLSTDMQFMLMAIPVLLVLARLQRRPTQTAHRAQFVAFTSKEQQLTFIGADGGRGQNQSRGSATNAQSNEEDAIAASFKAPKYEIHVGKRLVVLGYGFVALLGLSSAIASMIYGMVQSEVDLSYIIKFVPHSVAILSRNIAMYTNALFRFRAFAVGLILGHVLYLYEFKLITLPKFIQRHGAKISTIMFAVGFCVMFAPVLYPLGKVILSHDVTALLTVMAACGIDLFLSILIFFVCIGKAPRAALFLLNSPAWSVISSLSLSAFLVHAEVIILLTSQLAPPPQVQYSILLFVFSATLILTYLIALCLYLAFELPFSRLVEALMRKYFARSKTVSSDNPSDRQTR